MKNQRFCLCAFWVGGFWCGQGLSSDGNNPLGA